MGKKGWRWCPKTGIWINGKMDWSGCGKRTPHSEPNEEGSTKCLVCGKEKGPVRQGYWWKYKPQ